MTPNPITANYKETKQRTDNRFPNWNWESAGVYAQTGFAKTAAQTYKVEVTNGGLDAKLILSDDGTAISLSGLTRDKKLAGAHQMTDLVAAFLAQPGTGRDITKL
ncbi:MAG: hypothetical protein Q9184_007682, partial [Pyrenodesmia sp. 2 TL-2023]